MKQETKENIQVILRVIVFIILATIFFTAIIWGAFRLTGYIKHNIEYYPNSIPANKKHYSILYEQEVIQNPRLLEISNRLGLDVNDLNLRYRSDISTKNTNLISLRDGFIIGGIFKAPNTILIDNKLSKKAQLKAVGHEYLHYKWSTMRFGQRHKLTAELQDYAKNSPTLKNLVDGYILEEKPEEMYAYACTEIKELPKILKTHCDGQIPNRNILY